MKRLWIGVGLLLMMLVLGLCLTEFMENTHRAQSQALHRAAVLAADGDLAGAEALTGAARSRWERGWNTVAAFADHAPMDEIDARFSELKILARAHDASAYGASCAYLASLLEAMAKSHALSWWNLM